MGLFAVDGERYLMMAKHASDRERAHAIGPHVAEGHWDQRRSIDRQQPGLRPHCLAGAAGQKLDECLRITGITPGRYDVKLTFKDGRACTVRNIEIKDGAVFSIDDKDLTECHKP